MAKKKTPIDLSNILFETGVSVSPKNGKSFTIVVTPHPDFPDAFMTGLKDVAANTADRLCGAVNLDIAIHDAKTYFKGLPVPADKKSKSKKGQA